MERKKEVLGWCDCGLAEEDPLHRGWHGIREWNIFIFDLHRKNYEQMFEKKYGHEQTRPDRGPAEEIPF